MAGNTFGKLFTVTTFGESHGLALGAIIDGCPPGLKLTEEDIQKDLDRRKPGQSKFVTQRKESDTVKILSGVFEGVTTGTPIGLVIENEDQRSRDYNKNIDKFRPGHADFTYEKKYGIRDHRGGGRSSARETAMRVAAGAIARKYLFEHCQLNIFGYLSQIGELPLEFKDSSQIYENGFFCADPEKIELIEKYITQLRRDGDSVGAKITIQATNMPIGLGEPVFDKLEADLAKGLMSINAVKGFEIGDGFKAVSQRGSEHRDEITKNGFTKNSSGGTLGGISSGQDLLMNIVLKPTSSIQIPGKTVNKDGQETDIVTTGRHDPCVGIRATPIAEAMVALVLMDHLMRNHAQNHLGK